MGALGDMSVAAGLIHPGVISSIHMHPIVTHVTNVLSGRLGIRMKDPDVDQPHDLELQAGTAALTRPGTLFQLRNTRDKAAKVLYIASPTYVFEMTGGTIRYDDAVLVAQTWEELEAAHYRVPALSIPRSEVAARRAGSLRRLAARKTRIPQESLL